MQAPGGSEEDLRSGFTHGGWAMPFVDDTLNIVETAGEYDMLVDAAADTETPGPHCPTHHL